MQDFYQMKVSYRELETLTLTGALVEDDLQLGSQCCYETLISCFWMSIENVADFIFQNVPKVDSLQGSTTIEPSYDEQCDICEQLDYMAEMSERRYEAEKE